MRGITVDRDDETPAALERQRFAIGELVDDEDADVFDKVSERSYLSAEWIRLKATTGESTFEDYRTMMLAKLPISTKIDLLLTYVQKHRKEDFQLSLWLRNE